MFKTSNFAASSAAGLYQRQTFYYVYFYKTDCTPDY